MRRRRVRAARVVISIAWVWGAAAVIAGASDPTPEWQGRIPPVDFGLGPLKPPADASGALLAFSALVEGNWDIFTWDLVAGHPPTQRTRTPYDESAPTLAPDRSFAVYESVDGKLWRLPLKPDAAPEALPFGSDQRFDMHPTASPDGRSVAMASSLDRTSDDTDLIVYDAVAKTFGRRLELISYQHYPAWAPDGIHVVFSNLQGRLQTGKPICELWVMRTDAPWARQLTLLDGLAIAPSWSPRGDRVVFACDRGDGFDLWMLDPVSRRCARLTEDQAADTDPVFSPDGKSIIFVSTRGERLGLWRIDPETTRMTPVAPFGESSAVLCKDPDWK